MVFGFNWLWAIDYAVQGNGVYPGKVKVIRHGKEWGWEPLCAVHIVYLILVHLMGIAAVTDDRWVE